MSNETLTQIELTIGDRRLIIPVGDNMQCLVKGELPPIHELASAVQMSLDNPYDFPPFSQSVFPDDKVALAVDPEIPRVVEVVKAVVEYLMKSGTSEKDLCIVLAHNAFELSDQLRTALPDTCAIKIHNADDTSELAYVGAGESADPIYINRHLVDADVVIPCILARQDASFCFGGPYGIVPAFVDRKTAKRFESIYFKRDLNAIFEFHKESANMLGILATLVAVPGDNSSLVAFEAGEPCKSMNEAQRKLIESLPNAGESKFDLVIGVLDGRNEDQTWDNLIRAISVAQHSTTQTGSIVIISELASKVTGVLKILASLESDEKILKRIDESLLPNSSAARALFEARSANPVFLMSQIQRESLEDIGLGFIESLEDVVRLAKKSKKCLVLGSCYYRSHPEETLSPKLASEVVNRRAIRQSSS